MRVLLTYATRLVGRRTLALLQERAQSMRIFRHSAMPGTEHELRSKVDLQSQHTLAIRLDQVLDYFVVAA